MKRMADDPGTAAFVVVLKRTKKSDLPKLSKVADDKIYHSFEDAWEARYAIPEDIRRSFEVRSILVYFCER